ncbi:hypothetical protein GCM10029964_078760 [Kibdelosporangium lantanae]
MVSVAVVGVGPRGLSVVERLVLRARGPVTVWAIDSVEHGAGRVWRSDQPEWFTMNATAGEVTVASPDSRLDGFLDWSTTFGPTDYPPRRTYGAYLSAMFRRLCDQAPPHVTIRPVLGEVTRLSPAAGRYVLTLEDGRTLAVDKVVLATGHGPSDPRPLVDGRIAADIAPDMPLDDIPAGATVAVRGLGLSFYDVTRALTIGRGGDFRRTAGHLRYRPSGYEPRILAGSRGGLPFLARTRFDQAPEAAPRPTVFTPARLDDLREHALRVRGSTKLDFAREVEPLILAEARAAYGRDVKLDDVARPFTGQRFATPGRFRDRLTAVLRRDVTEAREAGPLKAALETLRATRPLLPDVVDFGGLLPASHEDFLTRFAPWSFILSAGPPDSHVEQLVALVEAGVVDVVGPAARFGDGPVTVESPWVAGSRRTADVFVDARVPVTDIRHSRTPLYRGLYADGLVSEFVNTDPATGESFATGGMAVTPAPCRVVDRYGRPNLDIHAIGVATEHTRWFTQVGTGRPGQDSPFCREADAIAIDILGPS